MPDVVEPLRRLSHAARRPPPKVAFERPPPALVASLRAAAAEAAAGATALALLEAHPWRSCGALLDELGERQERAEEEAHEVLHSRFSGVEPRLLCVLFVSLAEILRDAQDAGAWWCRSARGEAGLHGIAGALRDATRELARAIDRYPDPAFGEPALAVHRRISEGRRLARHARAVAIERGDLREVLGRMSAIAAVERALGACSRAATTLQRLSA